MIGSQLGALPTSPQQSGGMALPDIHTILQMLFNQMPGAQAEPQNNGTLAQQQAGIFGQLGGPAGSLYGMYGSFYGDRVPQPAMMQNSTASPYTFGSMLGAR